MASGNHHCTIYLILCNKINGPLFSNALVTDPMGFQLIHHPHRHQPNSGLIRRIPPFTWLTEGISESEFRSALCSPSASCPTVSVFGSPPYIPFDGLEASPSTADSEFGVDAHVTSSETGYSSDASTLVEDVVPDRKELIPNDAQCANDTDVKPGDNPSFASASPPLLDLPRISGKRYSRSRAVDPSPTLSQASSASYAVAPAQSLLAGSHYDVPPARSSAPASLLTQRAPGKRRAQVSDISQVRYVQHL